MFLVFLWSKLFLRSCCSLILIIEGLYSEPSKNNSTVLVPTMILILRYTVFPRSWNKVFVTLNCLTFNTYFGQVRPGARWYSCCPVRRDSSNSWSGTRFPSWRWPWSRSFRSFSSKYSAWRWYGTIRVVCVPVPYLCWYRQCCGSGI